MAHYLLGITGASGAIYATRTLFYLQKFGHRVSVIFSDTGMQVAEFEEQFEFLKKANAILDNKDLFSFAASGSSCVSGMALVPCSMGSLGKLANGVTDNLIIRAADVCLKEHKHVVVVPREMPYNLIHLKNMEQILLAGATIVPASPQFYSKPKTIEDAVDTVVAKIIWHLGIENRIIEPWGSPC